MAKVVKPSIPADRVEAWLLRHLGPVAGFGRLSEGLASQAFVLQREGQPFVLRLNPRIEGFRKDAYVQRAFARPGLPVPEVVEIGSLPEHGVAYCISRRAGGRRVSELDPARIARPVADTIAAIAASDLAGTSGFGRFDAAGVAPHATWRAFVLSIEDRDWAPVRRRVAPTLLDRLLATIRALLDHCPERRALVHGDFGGSNVLSDGQAVTAVIDWDLALFGDPLYEWANLAFWDEACLRPAIALAPRRLPAFEARLRCYLMRIGLEEIHGSATGTNPIDLGWLTARCAELLRS